MYRCVRPVVAINTLISNKGTDSAYGVFLSCESLSLVPFPAGIRNRNAHRRLDFDPRSIEFSHLLMFIQMVSISFISSIFGRFQTMLTYIETDATRPSWRFTVRRCYSHQIQVLSCDRERVIMSTHHLNRRRRCRHSHRRHITICSTYFSRIYSCRSCLGVQCAALPIWVFQLCDVLGIHQIQYRTTAKKIEK